MGNDICCQQTTSQQLKQQAFFNHTNSTISGEKSSPINQQKDEFLQSLKSSLSPQIRKIIQEHRPFEEQFNAQQQIRAKRYGNDAYEGQIDIINRPCKIGKMYKENGAYFIGHFVSGKAEGPCFYIMKDGSFYQGSMKDNQTDCDQGRFVSKDFQYVGGFKNNNFHGKGVQKSPSHHYSFEGFYEHGKKKFGVMKWWSNHCEYVYEGAFDENGKYTGKGKLSDPQGNYEGEFLNGQRHGFGVYYYKTQLRYEGFYSHGKKQGQGKLFNNDNSIAYKGVFKNGMPNGKGTATTKNGVEFETQWIDGIDSRLL